MQIRAAIFAIALLAAGSSTVAAATATYTYDDLGRLWKVCYGTMQIVYTYDQAGNRTTVVTQGVCN